MKSSLFRWTSFDVNSLLPRDWQKELTLLAKQGSISRILRPKSVTSRESHDVHELPVDTVGGVELANHAPWLSELYNGEFRTLAEEVAGEPIHCAQDQRIGINLNVQAGSSARYEAHIDSNPLEGLLYVTTHSPGTGGELVVGQNEFAIGVDEIDSDAAIIYPVAGHLIFFDARRNPHYVRRLRADHDLRVVAAMNFFTAGCNESHRPQDLNMHLFGSE